MSEDGKKGFWGHVVDFGGDVLGELVEGAFEFLIKAIIHLFD